MLKFVLAMQMESIIGSLLLRHNCVVVPGFGGFVAKQISAQIDYKNGIMLPPRKSLLFNRQLINNDGLLISEFAREANTSYDEASQIVKEKVATWTNSLNSGERVSIDKVGFLFYDQEKNICFEQDRFFNLLLASYGLGKVHFVNETDVALVQHTAQEEPIKVAEEEKIIPALEVVKPIEKEEKAPIIVPIQQDQKKRSSAWKYIAAACILPIAFYSIWIPMKTDVLESGMISIKDFNPFNKAATSVYESSSLDLAPIEQEEIKTLEEQISELQADVATYQYNFTEDFYVTVRLPEKEVEPIFEDSQITEVQPVNTDTKGNYDYIVGCFADVSNASSLIADLKAKGFNAYEVDVKGGLHRISAGNAISRTDLTVIQNASTEAGYQGWVLKK